MFNHKISCYIYIYKIKDYIFLCDTLSHWHSNGNKENETDIIGISKAKIGGWEKRQILFWKCSFDDIWKYVNLNKRMLYLAYGSKEKTNTGWKLLNNYINKTERQGDKAKN